MHKQARATLFNFGAKKAFAALCDRLRAMLAKSRKEAQEMREMLAASFVKLNSEYGFSLAADTSADVGRFAAELDTIEQNYVHYLGLSQALKLSEPAFIDQFRRMLLSKLRVIFENACCELELWSRSISSQLDTQLRERRRNFRRRREALERIQSAANELEARLAELAAQEQRLQQLHDGLAERADAVCAEARSIHADADALEGQRAEATRGTRIALAG
jgi:chromosome segregation ATPase